MQGRALIIEDTETLAKFIGHRPCRRGRHRHLHAGHGGIEGTRIKKASWPGINVVAMSAGLDARITPAKALMAARVTGADADIPKPFDSETLLGAVERRVE